MKKLLSESFNLVQRVYNTKTGKNPLLIFVDPKTSTDNTFEFKDKFKEYGMVYLPSKLGKYVPHAWGWVLWNGEQDKQMSFVKKFINDLPTLESPQENGQTRGFDEITSNLGVNIQEILKGVEEASKVATNTGQDPETQKRIDDFKQMLQNELGNEETHKFIEQLVRYRAELKKHNIYNLGWTNTILVFFAKQGTATQVRPLGEWQKMGYEAKDGAVPIYLIGKNYKHIAYTKAQKEKIIQKYLAEKGVATLEELPKSSQYDLMHRRLKGIVVPGSEYQFTYKAYDILDVQPIGGADVETEPEEPDSNWWWDKLPRDEKDDALTQALIEFAQSDECGNITINTDNTKEGLGGARGNATNTGEINLINDEYLRFPTAVHELTHQLRHWEYASQNNPSLKRFYNRWAEREIREQEAELCAAFVVANYGYNIQSHLNYVHSWNLTKVNASQVMDQIAEVATFIENGLNKYLKKEQE